MQIDNARDTAGAGDWCSAGIIHALFQSLSDSLVEILSKITKTQLEQIFSFGQFLSALNCNFYGARGAMYNLKFAQITQSYSHYLKTREIRVPKSEPGFALNKKPFDFHKLL